MSTRDRLQSPLARRQSSKGTRVSPGACENRRDDKRMISNGREKHARRSGLRDSAEGKETIAPSDSTTSSRAMEAYEEHSQANQGHDDGSDELFRPSAPIISIHDSNDHGTSAGCTTSCRIESHNEGHEGTTDGIFSVPGTGSSPSYIGYSYYQFLAINNIASIPAQDYQFLELQGCLHVPVLPVLDIFIHHYFLHMHPVLPILDEGAFWDRYDQRPNGREPDSKISLLLFQTMLFACCNVSLILLTLSRPPQEPAY